MTNSTRSVSSGWEVMVKGRSSPRQPSTSSAQWVHCPATQSNPSGRSKTSL